MKRDHFPVEIDIDGDGVYVVSCPAFKACRAGGSTIDIALENLTDVIERCLKE